MKENLEQLVIHKNAFIFLLKDLRILGEKDKSFFTSEFIEEKLQKIKKEKLSTTEPLQNDFFSFFDFANFIFSVGKIQFLDIEEQVSYL